MAPEVSVTVAGAGGNIGGQLVRLLARIRELARVRLVDPDFYEARNRAGQDMMPDDIGKRKVVVQGRWLKRANPAIKLERFPCRLEDLPLGVLRATVMLACLHDRLSRLAIARAAWRLGRPFIDAGIQVIGLLARVAVYMPGPDAPCYECAFDDDDYAALPQAYPCSGNRPVEVPATNAPSSLGALAASLQAIELLKLVTGQSDRVAVGREILIDAASHQYYITSLRRNPQCHFNHRVWDIRPLECEPNSTTVERALALTGIVAPFDGAVLRVEDKRFVTKLTCPVCGTTRNLVHLATTLDERRRVCPGCGGQMNALGFDLTDRLDLARVPRQVLGQSFRRIGLRRGDVLSIETLAGEAHYEIAPATQPEEGPTT